MFLFASHFPQGVVATVRSKSILYRSPDISARLIMTNIAKSTIQMIFNQWLVPGGNGYDHVSVKALPAQRLSF